MRETFQLLFGVLFIVGCSGSSEIPSQNPAPNPQVPLRTATQTCSESLPACDGTCPESEACTTGTSEQGIPICFCRYLDHCSNNATHTAGDSIASARYLHYGTGITDCQMFNMVCCSLMTGGTPSCLAQVNCAHHE